jgi:hypothetical protein
VQVRQGDIFLEQVRELPEQVAAVEPSDRGGKPVHVLATGETTGHAHCVAARLGVTWFVSTEPAIPPTLGWLRLTRQALLEHDEHAPVALPRGSYRVVRQRRYDPASDVVNWRHAGD